jgi:hypothetical protein
LELLSAQETELVGSWEEDDGSIVADAVAVRIDWLISNVLAVVGASKDGWSTVYRNPSDERFWLHTYPQSEMHGGGPPSLRAISADEVADYVVDATST